MKHCSCGKRLGKYEGRSCYACKGRRRSELMRIYNPPHYAVARAVRHGELANLSKTSVPCADCGKRAEVYDHRDYSKPLEVAPVCRGCNVRRGPAIGSGAKPQVIDPLLKLSGVA